MAGTSNHIEDLFITRKYKRFFYPTNPFFTIQWGVFFTLLGVVGFLPMAWAYFAAAFYVFADAPWTPIMSVITAVNNLAINRKALKAWVMITIISLVTVVSSIVGLLLLLQNPALIASMGYVITASACSPILMAIGSIVGGIIAHHSKKYSFFAGIFIGGTIACFIPTNIPMILEALFLIVTGCTFAASIITKQSMRLYFWYCRGDTNADGHEIDREKTAQTKFIIARSAMFNVSPKDFTALTNECQQCVTNIKQQISWWQEMMGERHAITNSYKDIYHGLMQPHLNAERVIQIQDLLRNSYDANTSNTDNEKHQTDSYQIILPSQKNVIPQKPLTIENSRLAAENLFIKQALIDKEHLMQDHKKRIIDGGGLSAQLLNPFTTRCNS